MSSIPIENAAAVSRVPCKLIPLRSEAEPSLHIIVACRQIAAFDSVVLKSVGVDFVRLRLAREADEQDSDLEAVLRFGSSRST